MSYIQDMKDKEDRMTTDRALSTLCESHNGIEMSPLMRRHYEYLRELQDRFIGKVERKRNYVLSFISPTSRGKEEKEEDARLRKLAGDAFSYAAQSRVTPWEKRYTQKEATE